MSNAFTAPTYQSGNRSIPAANTASTQEQTGAALEFLRNMAAEVSRGTVDLPCFPDVVIRVRNALADPRTTAEQTVRIVGAEPRLAARLLQTANSVAFNQSGKPITDLRTAVTRLGHQLVQSASMAFAVQQMKNEASLRSIAKPLTALWRESIAVASISQVVARRTKVSPDEAFLTGLLHGIGRLYIMVRAVGRSPELSRDQSCLSLVAGWHASIGKAVLENWGFADEMSEAVGDQEDLQRKHKRDPDLTDVLIASVILAEALNKPMPQPVPLDEVSAFQCLGFTAQDCTSTLTHAQYQLAALHEALGC